MFMNHSKCFTHFNHYCCKLPYCFLQFFFSYQFVKLMTETNKQVCKIKNATTYMLQQQ